ncbi:uncharacterized protein [Argopecten irradians]|uniref:uncharacterized protein n=1 Tax=Argopecten irradians TaxID=31199 RepID=UPI00371258AA
MSPVKASSLVTVVCDTESLCSDKVAPVRNSNNETITENSSANAQTDSSVKEISNEVEEIQVESDDEVKIIDDTFDIGLVSELFFSVIFHGSKLLCITCLSGKYFVVRELLNKCFIDIAEKNKKKGVFLSKLFKQVYIAKERDLNIPYVELPMHLRPSVGEYLTKEKLLRNGLVCHIGIIHVNDAKRLYHFFYGVKSCHDLKCVSQWPPIKETKNEAVLCTSNQDESRPETSNEVDDQIDGENFTEGTDTADGDVEIISCQVIYDRNVTSDGSDTERQKSMSTKEPSRTSVDGEKRSKGRKKSPRSAKDWQKEKLLQRKRKRRQLRTSGDKGDLSDDSDATIPYMDDPEAETDAECDQGRISSSVSPDNSENTGKAQSPAHSGATHSGDNISDVSAPVVNIADSSNHEDPAAVNSDSNLEDDDEPQEIRIDPDQNEDYVVKGGIAELYEGMFRFLVINGRKFFPFEDLCHHYEKQDLISCLKSKPGHFKAIRCSVIETEFLNNLEPELPVLEENATIIEENFLHCSAKLNFRKLFDNSEQEIVDLTTDDDAVVPERLGDSPTLTPEASPTLTNPCNVSAFESFNNDDMIVDTSDDILMMELGTANCDTRGDDSISTKDGSSKDDLSTIDGREQKAVADAFRDIWVENHSLKSKMAMMSQDFEETKKETMDFEATCQQYGDAIELMTKAMQQTCSEDEKKNLT